LSTFGNLPRVQVQTDFDHFGLGFRLTLTILLNAIVLHIADSVAASVAALSAHVI
jgi:hypothetical protein